MSNNSKPVDPATVVPIIPTAPIPINVSGNGAAATYPYTGYYITVPSGGYNWNINTNTSGTWTLGGIDLGGDSQSVPAKPKKKRERDGCDCLKCKSFFEYAEPNQKDEETFICYGCRTGF